MAYDGFSLGSHQTGLVATASTRGGGVLISGRSNMPRTDENNGAVGILMVVGMQISDSVAVANRALDHKVCDNR